MSSGRLSHRLAQALDAVIAARRDRQTGLGSGDLADLIKVNRGQARELLSSLERRGFLARDPAKFHFRHAQVTAAGHAAHKLTKRLGPIRIGMGAHAPRGAGAPQLLFVKKVVASSLKGTAFPTMVFEPEQFCFMRGINMEKLGETVNLGWWRGMPFYYLTLEERATCPEYCAHWPDCYGNNSPRSKRNRAGPKLEASIEWSLGELDRRHPNGYVVRLHQLGDFYSLEYALAWRRALDEHQALRVFGYTAHDPGSEIGFAVWMTNTFYPKRWAVRPSGADVEFSAQTINYIPDKPRTPEGFVCPEQLGLVDTCGDCGFCWHSRGRVLFIDHALLAMIRAQQGQKELVDDTKDS